MREFVLFSLLAISASLSAEPLNLDVSKNGRTLDWLRVREAKLENDAKGTVLSLEGSMVTNGSDGGYLEKHPEELLLALEPVGQRHLLWDTYRMRMRLTRPIKHEGVMHASGRFVLSSAHLFNVRTRILLPALTAKQPMRMQFMAPTDFTAETMAVEVLWTPDTKTWKITYGPVGEPPVEPALPIKAFATLNAGFTPGTTELKEIAIAPKPHDLPDAPKSLRYFATAGKLAAANCPDARPLTLEGTTHAVAAFDQRVAFVDLWQGDGLLNPFGVGCATDPAKTTDVTLDFGYPFDKRDATMASFVVLGQLPSVKKTGYVNYFAWQNKKDGTWQLQKPHESIAGFPFPLP